MGAEPVLRVLLYIVLVVLAGTAVWTAVQAALAARSLRSLADDLDRKLPPLIDQASVTLDDLHAEIGKVDGIVSQIEEVSDRVGATTRTASGIVNAPVAAVVGIGDRVRRMVSILVGRRV